MSSFRAEHVSESALPIINVSPLRHGTTDDRQAVGREIRAACLDLGFMYVVGHGVDPDLRADVFAQSAAFFALPEDRKYAIDMKLSPHNRGYEPLGGLTLEDGTQHGTCVFGDDDEDAAVFPMADGHGVALQ